MNEQRWLKMNDAERAAETGRVGAELDTALAGLARQSAAAAAGARAAAAVAAEDLEKSRGDSVNEPRNREKLAGALRAADTWESRARHAAAGRLLLTQAEMGDVSFMGTYQHLISMASDLDRVDHEAGT